MPKRHKKEEPEDYPLELSLESLPHHQHKPAGQYEHRPAGLSNYAVDAYRTTNAPYPSRTDPYAVCPLRTRDGLVCNAVLGQVNFSGNQLGKFYGFMCESPEHEINYKKDPPEPHKLWVLFPKEPLALAAGGTLPRDPILSFGPVVPFTPLVFQTPVRRRATIVAAPSEPQGPWCAVPSCHKHGMQVSPRCCITHAQQVEHYCSYHCFEIRGGECDYYGHRYKTPSGSRRTSGSRRRSSGSRDSPRSSSPSPASSSSRVIELFDDDEVLPALPLSRIRSIKKEARTKKLGNTSSLGPEVIDLT
uniref:C3H1-type domain-containing protein n=1 Tax=Mycena chlorophos TaxID=658473 RepID=A0ABQ0KUV0_MYCCL|nr:predicted protein [Mycena chlorophos]